MTIGKALTLELKIENPGPEPLPCEIALHSYLVVSDVRRVQLHGLEQTDYLDKMAGFRRKTQPDAPVTFTAETDRIYLNTDAACRVVDVGKRRHVALEKTGSDTTVVWNPWVDKARAMPDFADHDWPRMVCVETANAAENALRIPPGDSHLLSATLWAEAVG